MKYFGCSGQQYDGWKGTFYPRELSKIKWLEYYATKFNTVEINYTFYRFPSEKSVKNWYKRTPKNFKITLKGSRFVTHVKKIKNVKTPIKKFYKMSDLLKEKLGCILWQLPPMLKKDTERLEKFCKNLDPKYNNIIEFRNKTWFDKETYKVLKKNKVGYCIISAPKLPDDIQITSKTAYIRFHGRQWYNYNYSKKELNEWAKKIKKIKAKEVYCYFNNDWYAYAPKNCLVLKKLIK